MVPAEVGLKEPQRSPGPRRAARLAAVQALYQIEALAGDAEDIIFEFLTERRGVILDGEDVIAMDRDFFSDLVRGSARRQREIDRVLSGGLAAGWRLERIASVLRGILRCACYELLMRSDVPARATINEYVDVAHAFFAEEQCSFVNAILDRIARQIRADEFGDGDDGRSADSG